MFCPKVNSLGAGWQKSLFIHLFNYFNKKKKSFEKLEFNEKIMENGFQDLKRCYIDSKRHTKK